MHLRRGKGLSCWVERGEEEKSAVDAYAAPGVEVLEIVDGFCYEYRTLKVDP